MSNDVVIKVKNLSKHLYNKYDNGIPKVELYQYISILKCLEGLCIRVIYLFTSVPHNA